MTIDYPSFCLALVLLCFPRQWLRFGRKATHFLHWSRRSSARSSGLNQVREPGEARLNLRDEFTKTRNYIDFFRALTGGLLLVGNKGWGIDSCFTIDPDPSAQTSVENLSAYLHMAFFLVGVLIQFLRFERKITFYAPVFYLGGVGFALCGIEAGVMAFVAGWTINSAAPLSPAGFLSLYALLVYMLGLLFRGVSDVYVIFAGAVSFLPVLVSLLARRSLALFVKRVKPD